MFKVQTTKGSADKVKALCYADAGVGKTTLCSTAPTPLILSNEGGLLSLDNHDIPYIKVESYEMFKDLLDWASDSEEAKQYETLCLDSLSEIAEVLLTEFSEESDDPRKLYPKLTREVTRLVKGFRDLDQYNVYMTAKIHQYGGEDDIVKFRPDMPGRGLLSALPYWFDEVMALRIGKTDDGEEYRFLQTQPSTQFIAKDRSGKLSQVEKPDLAYIFNKIRGEK